MDLGSNLNTAQSTDESRRDFVKKVAYVTPLILSFSVKPALAQTGSGDERPTESVTINF